MLLGVFLSGENNNRFVQENSGSDDGSGPWVAKVLLFFPFRVRWITASDMCECLQYMEKRRPIDNVEKTIMDIYFKRNGENEVDHRLRRGTEILKKPVYVWNKGLEWNTWRLFKDVLKC